MKAKISRCFNDIYVIVRKTHFFTIVYSYCYSKHCGSNCFYWVGSMEGPVGEGDVCGRGEGYSMLDDWWVGFQFSMDAYSGHSCMSTHEGKLCFVIASTG